MRKGGWIFLLAIVFFVSCQPKIPPQLPPPEQPSQPPEHHHEAALVPTPLAQLKERPLDLYPDCDPALVDADHACALLILYPDRIEALDWKKNETKQWAFRGESVAAVRSRAPSGKIMPFRKGYLVLSNTLASPQYLAGDLASPPAPVKEPLEGLPLPEPGLNTFMLRNGRFFDFQFLSKTSLAVVDTAGNLEVGSGGALIKADKQVGGTFCFDDPVFFASSPSLPDQPDSILKFALHDDAITFDSTHDADGEIVDLAISDLNRDQKKELLVTTVTTRGIFIEVMDPF
jgi:hypothetical protein